MGKRVGRSTQHLFLPTSFLSSLSTTPSSAHQHSHVSFSHPTSHFHLYHHLSHPRPPPHVSLIHVLLLNANGDLYQIADKFSQSSSLPTTDDYDDGIDEPFSDGSAATPAPPVDGMIDTTTTVNTTSSGKTTTTTDGSTGSSSSSPSPVNRNGQGLRGRLRRAKHFHNGGIPPPRHHSLSFLPLNSSFSFQIRNSCSFPLTISLPPLPPVTPFVVILARHWAWSRGSFRGGGPLLGAHQIGTTTKPRYRATAATTTTTTTKATTTTTTRQRC